MKKIKTFWETFKGLGALTPLLLFSIIGPALGVVALVATSEVWFPGLSHMDLWTLIPLHFFLTIVLVGLSLVPTHASSLIAGMLFGIVLGPVLALCGVVAASFFSLHVANAIIKESSSQLLLQRPAAAKVHEELLMRSRFKSIVFIALVRLSPIMPFAATNVILAASKTQIGPFLWGSSVGLAPRVIMVAIAGAGLSELDFSKNSNIWLAVLGGLSTILLIVYIGKVVKKVLRRAGSKKRNLP